VPIAAGFGIARYSSIWFTGKFVNSEVTSEEERISAQREKFFRGLITGLRPQPAVFHRDGLHIIQRAPLVLADIIFVNAAIDADRLLKIGWDLSPLPGNEKPPAILQNTVTHCRQIGHTPFGAEMRQSLMY